MKASDYVVLAIIVTSAMISTALGAHVAGFELPPIAIFALLVVGAPLPLLLAVLPALGIRVPQVPQTGAPTVLTATVAAHE